ncbi:MAG: cob(I)yrinic acid a,c-diamide adenosyltransferase [Eubacteriales bacterium]|nr:cob(I)yrinic acid a,c-diamide adenosyltransferase [Eubacteriales bacterium]
MEKELLEAYCGSGHGKTMLAIGQSIQAAVAGKKVIIIHFLKGKEQQDTMLFEKLNDLDINVFRFEKFDKYYEELSEQEKDEEKINILNGLHFANKVITTQGCDFLILDEILGLPDCGIASVECIADILKGKDDSMHICLTGRVMPEELRQYVDRITTITTEQ